MQAPPADTRRSRALEAVGSRRPWLAGVPDSGCEALIRGIRVDARWLRIW